MNFLGDAYLSIMNKTLDGLWARQEVISDNLANFETPNYKRKTVDFETYLQNAINTTEKNDKKSEASDKHLLRYFYAFVNQNSLIINPSIGSVISSVALPFTMNFSGIS